MKARVILYTLLIFIFVTAQVTVLNMFKFFGLTPNIIIILVVSIALLEGKIQGAVVGFISGLCLDAVVGRSLGFYALFGMFLGLALGNINKRFFKENILVMGICTFVSSIVYESVIVITNNLFFTRINFTETLVHYIIPEACINSIAGIIIFIIIIRLMKRIPAT